MNRREFLSGLSVGVIGAISGCSGLTGPDPSVEEIETEAGLSALVGIITFHITVVNEGRAGDVVVTLELLDNTDTVLEKYREEIYMGKDERRRVTMEVQVPDETEDYRATAEPA